jgi:hypothetical protein
LVEFPIPKNRVNLDLLEGEMNAKSTFEKVNEELANVGMNPIKKEGLRPDEIQVTGFVTSFKVPGRFILGILSTLTPIKRERETHIIMHDLNCGSVVFLVVNNKYLITTKQYRLPFGRFIENLPRGWTDDSESNPALQIVRRKAPAVLKIGEVIDIIELTTKKMDDSIRDGSMVFSLMHVTTHKPVADAEELQDLLREEKSELGIVPIVRTLEEAFEQLDNIPHERNWLEDKDSMTCLLLVERRLRKSSKPELES